MKRNLSLSSIAVLGCSLAFAFGCSPGSRENSAPSAVAPSKHEHHPPHGGTPVVLGDEAYHLEFVLDATEGKLSAYILDGEMEEFVRIRATSFAVSTIADGKKGALAFEAIANSATGETVGDTALFEAKATWLKTAKEFEAVLASLEIRGTTFTNIAFNFPKGSDAD